ncbi:hypothetical protein DAPPUDRAFT_316583 [Daphnia pulex]|uniref:Uncharacterized protein n=1 Tax=Daphnia pulex TaxID=6669 RepID=E9GDD2_DAPPU|nr:hypothetical protein DAPPUDRAFT_334125 [Daphnia pulex]EFX82498.1 hypothetical protein DAPPUDRAFT_316583 [Daphnia pulex]|eukprot:EFX64496.1 hypothetical protein DAPPUDRAFT_334125 [Daphnia pulex]
MTQMSIGIKPIPSDVNLQKERPVSFMLEGHGDHHVGFMAFPLEGHGDHCVKLVMQWCKSKLCRRAALHTTTYDAPSYYTESPKYYSSPSYATKAHVYYTEAPDCYATTYAAPSYYTEAPKYYSAPSYCTEAPA